MRSLLTAAAISLAFTLLLTPVFLRLFRKWGWGQVIRTPESISNPSHQAKRGTPTMGGVIFILGTAFGYGVGTFTGGSYPTVSGLLVIWLMLGFGAVGFIDDYMKLRQRNSLGLSGWRKILGQVLVMVPFGIVALTVRSASGNTPASEFVSLFRDIPVLWLFALGPIVGWLLYLLWISVIGIATSNSVNLTDGLDGLAAGASVMVFGAYTLIGIWQSNQSCGSPRQAGGGCYTVRDPLDLALLAAILSAALVGFLWWNTSPAKIFMGDTGSLAIGGAVAGFAILSRTELLLAFIGGLFVLITLSVIIQVGYFKATGGKRVFKMAPLQHHFELKGWAEVTVVVRFWILCGLFVAAGLGIFYAEWVVLL